MADGNLKDLQRLLNKAMQDIPEDVPRIIQVEGLAFINKNFKDQGFNTGSGVKSWKKRKTTNAQGRDITRYKTNRRGRKGTLTKYGRNNKGRAILVGHKTNGNTLKNSFRVRRTKKQVRFYTYKAYAEYHNEGHVHMPRRSFMRPSLYLENKIKKKITRTLDRRFKK